MATPAIRGRLRKDTKNPLYLRCRKCAASVWLQADDPRGCPRLANCHRCGESHSLGDAADVGASAAEIHLKARRLGEQSGLDLPGAVSVLLGIMDLEEASRPIHRPAKAGAAVQVRDSGPPTGIDRPHATEGAPKRIQYDRAFEQAVSAGHLSIQQAIERGNREVYATRLSERHGFPMEVAYRVADGRIPIHRAIQQKREAPSPPASTAVAVATRPRDRWVTVLVACVVVLGIGFTIRSQWRGMTVEPPLASAIAAPVSAPVVAAPPPAPTNVGKAQTGPDGRLGRVEGSDPAAVLATYCETGREAFWRDAVEVVSTVPPSSGARMGIFADGRQDGALFAVQIRRDPSSRRWYLGDGRSIETFEVSRIPALAARYPDRPAPGPRDSRSPG